MRSVRVRRTAKYTRSGGRTKASARTEKRFDPREIVFGKRRRLRMDWLSRVLHTLAHTWPLHRPMLALTMLLVLFGAAAGLWRGGYAADARHAAIAGALGLSQDVGFTVRAITVSGNARTPEKVVLGALGAKTDDAILAVSPQAMRQNLLKLPWVADADVRRRFPDKIEVTLIEKQPFALWRDGNTLDVVERSGAVITLADGVGLPRLPLLVGAGAPEAAAPLIEAIQKYRAITARLRWAERVSERRWDLVLGGGVTVKLPEDGWAAQLADLERLIVDKGVLERDIEMIDLRFADSYIFRLRNGDSQPVARERRT